MGSRGLFCLDMKEITACLGREASMDKEIRVPGVGGGRLGRGDTLHGVWGGEHYRPGTQDPAAPGPPTNGAVPSVGAHGRREDAARRSRVCVGQGSSGWAVG